jgi:hypothetical protein
MRSEAYPSYAAVTNGEHNEADGALNPSGA